MHALTTAANQPRNLAELIAGQRAQGMIGFDDDEFIEIVRKLFDEELRTDRNKKLPASVANAITAEYMIDLLRLIRGVMEKIAAESTPWHAREWFLEVYEDHQEFEDHDDETNARD